MEDTLFKERSNIGTISKLHSLCQSFHLEPKSSFDPMYKVGIKLKSLINALQTLYDKHCVLYSQLTQNSSLNKDLLIYKDTEFLIAYETFFQSSIRLIFNSTNTTFRSIEESEFIKLFLMIYSHLKKSFQNVIEEQKLKQATENFENEFLQEFRKAHSNSYKGGKVVDVLSYSSNKIQYPNIESKDIIQSHLVKLSSKKLCFKKLLVEIVELDTNELAFFKIESCLSVIPKKYTADNLLKQLCMGKYQLLNFNKWLLFVPLKQNDMKIVEYTNSGIILETPIGNSIELSINSENLIEWETIWRKKFEQYFGERRKKILERNKLLNSEPLLNIRDMDLFEKHSHNSVEYKGKTSNFFQLNSINNSIDRCVLKNKEKSIKELESLSYEKLMELNDSIAIKLSPVVQHTPLSKQIIRSVSDTCTIEQVDPRISTEGETHDMESIGSEIENTHIDNTNINDELDNSDLFSSNISDYKPKLLKHKSSSLLSLFSSKKKSEHEKTQYTELHFSDMISQPSSTFDDIKDNIEKSVIEEYVSGLQDEELVNNLELFHDHLIKLSYWTKDNCWKQIGDKNITFDISRLHNGSVIMCAYKGEDRNKCYVVSKISNKLKMMQTTAQDIQLKFSNEDVIEHSFPHNLGTFMLTIRYHDIEALLEILRKSIANNFKKQLSTSVTEETLSTRTSSNLTSSMFSYQSSHSFSSVSLDKLETNVNSCNNPLSTKNTYTNIQSHLLLSDIKTKYYSLENGKFWKLLDTGNTTIYSQDIQNNTVNNRIGVTFEFISMGGITKKFNCHILNIHRLKKTGIVMQDDKNEYHLLAFTNSIIADHVFRSIQAIF